MKETVKLFLDRKIDRRTFIGRLAHIGLGLGTASRLAALLFAQAPLRGRSQPGRIVKNLTGGELMAEFLTDWKVPYIFGLGGSEEIGFLDALVDRLSLQYVQALHEGSVMSMADGYSRASGQTALVNLHSVAGAAYALAPMVNAFKDRIPIVVTVGRQATKIRGSNAFLEAVNLHQLPRDYTRWTWDVMDVHTIPDVLRRAFLLARVPPGGPTFITFSKDLWEQNVQRAEILPRSRSKLELELPPNPEQVKQTVDLLLEAEFPVIVAGRELNLYGGTDELAQIAELLGAPVFMNLLFSHSPVIFPTTHPNYAGMFSGDENFPKTFDLFWSIGGTMFTQVQLPPEPVVPRSCKVIHTGFDATEIGRNYPVDVAMMANVHTACGEILRELKKRKISSSTVEARRRVVENYHLERGRRLQRRAQEVWDNTPIASERLAVELNRRLDENAIIVSELVTSEVFLKNYIDIEPKDRRRWNITSSGGVLGWGVAAAVGAKIAQPDRQVVALVGDGSFQFGVQALWSAVRYEVPIAVVIWNNNGYQANRRFLHAYGGQAAETGKYIGASLDSPEIDNVLLAKGYGVEGERIEEPAKLGSALDRCFQVVEKGRPYLLDVKIQRRFGGADSKWYDFFSVARKESRKS